MIFDSWSAGGSSSRKLGGVLLRPFSKMVVEFGKVVAFREMMLMSTC